MLNRLLLVNPLTQNFIYLIFNAAMLTSFALLRVYHFNHKEKGKSIYISIVVPTINYCTHKRQLRRSLLINFQANMFQCKSIAGTKFYTKICIDENQVTNRVFHPLDKLNNIGIKETR